MSRWAGTHRNLLSSLLLVIVVAAVLVLVAASDGAGQLHADRHGVRQLVNQERAVRGIRPLRHSASLTFSAQRFANKLAQENRFGHDERIHAARRWWWLGEVLAKGQRTPKEVVGAWMDSTAHRSILLNSRGRAMGVGRAGDIWVAHFGELGPRRR